MKHIKNLHTTTQNLKMSFISKADVKKWTFIILSLALIFFAYQKTLTPLTENRIGIIKHAYYINELQNSILDTITLGQTQKVLHFDSLNAKVNELVNTVHNLSNNPAISQTQELKKAINNLLKKAQAQTEILDLFKMNYSALQNSSNYFPTAFKQCFKQVNNPKSLHYSQENIDLIQATLIEGISSLKGQSHQRGINLKRYVAEMKINELSTVCKTFISHTNILIEYLPQKQVIYDRLFELQLNKDTNRFYLLVEEVTSHAVDENKKYYSVIALFALFLIGYVAFTLSTLYRTNQQLSYTLDELSEQQGLLSTLININAATNQIEDKSKLFEAVCNITIKETSIDNCWIGLIQDDGTVKPIVTSGIGNDLTKNIRPSLDTSIPEGKGVVSESYSTQQAVITNEYPARMLNTPWTEQIQHWGVQGAAAIPIRIDDEIIGFFVAYTRKKHFFSSKINALLIQLVNDVDLALNRIKLELEQRQQQQDLAISAIAFDSHEAILITDANRTIIRANRAFTSLTGYRLEELTGKTPNIIKSGLHDKNFYQTLWNSIDKEGKWQGEIWNRKKDGSLYPSWQSISALYDDKGEISHYISHALDLTRDKESQREIHYLNNHDSLTKLPNRSLLIDRIEQELGQHHPNFSVLLLVNINRFKMFNESLGHTAADELLIKVGQRLKQCQFDDIYNITVARVGSDEFSLLCLSDFDSLNDATLEAGHIAKQIQSVLTSEFNIHNNEVVIDTSLGVTLFTPLNEGNTHHTPETLLQEANTALHRAKQSSTSSIQFFEPKMQQQAYRRLSLETELRSALTNNQFILHYQPQISLHSDEIIGMEALIRWNNSENKLVPPLDFIPILEETGLINQVGFWIMEEAVQQAKTLHTINPSLTMSVNLSTVQFNDPQLVPKVKTLLTDLDYPAAKLEFEITESLLMDDTNQALNKLNQLTELGINIAIDDFGTGYSSLSYLKKFPINRLKIDKSFIDEITNQEVADAAIVQATIEMAHALHIKTIAEGVEENDQLRLLKIIECDQVQGYYYSKPLPIDELTEFIKQQTI